MEKPLKSLPSADQRTPVPHSVLPPSSRNTFLIINTPGTTVLATEVAEKPWTPELQTWEAAAHDSQDPSPIAAPWPVWGSSGFHRKLRGHRSTKFGVIKEKKKRDLGAQMLGKRP